jgi:hypothetical protein
MDDKQRARVQTSKPMTNEAREKAIQGRKGVRSQVYWTQLEYAKVAREVDRMVADGDQRPVYMLVFEAQDRALDEDRRRPYNGIRHSMLDGGIEEGLRQGRTINSLTAKAEPEPEAVPAAEPAPPEPQPQVEAPPVDIAPQPSHAILRSADAPTMSAAAQAFGQVMMSALDDLLRAHSAALLERVQADMQAQAANTASVILAAVERGMASVVHKAIEAELGPMAPPTPENAPKGPPEALTGRPEATPSFTEPAATRAPVAEQPGQQERRYQLRVDVVGLVGQNCTRVREAFNGNTDIRFIEPEQVSSYAPHRGRHVIQCVKWVPHVLKAKLRAAKVDSIMIPNGASGAVIQAIEELHRARAMEVDKGRGA